MPSDARPTPKVKVKKKSSVGSAISGAAKGKRVSYGPRPSREEVATAKLQQAANDAAREVRKAKLKKVKPKSLPEKAAGNIGAALHLIAPRGEGKPAEKGKGRLPGGAGGSNALDLPNSAPGIVLRSTAANVVDDPKRTVVDTGKSIVGIPAGLIRAASNPREAVKGIGADYSHRYGDAIRGDYKAFHERQKKEGAAPEVFDIATAATVTGAGTGRVLQKGAKAGKLGKGAKRIATQTTKLRVSGGDAVKVREPSKNFYKNVAADKVHKQRVRVQKKRAAQPQASGIVREAEARGEVTPIRKGTAKRAQERSVAHEGGVTLQTMKAEQAREVHSTKTGVAASRRGLTKDEQAAYKYQAQYAPKSPAAARAVLVKHRERVVAERAANPNVRPIVDELPVIDKLIEKAEGAFTPRLRERVKGEGNRSRRLAIVDPGMGETVTNRAERALRRSHAPAAELLGIKPIAGESAVQFARRVRKAGHKEGLGAPAYFKSEEIPKGVHAAFAKGGKKMVAGEKAYTGALTRTGRESGDLEIVARSAAQNIKRRYNWNYVADTIDRHVFPWSKERKLSAHELEKELRHRGIDPSSVALWNPRLYREAQRGVTKADGAVDADPTLVSARVHSAAEHATASLDDLDLDKAHFQQAGWQLAPKAVIDEVMDSASGKFDGTLGRGYDITKGQISRVLLANPAWLGFQVGSNTMMTGLAGVTPNDLARSIRFYRNMPPAERAAHEALFGVHGWFKEQRRMGSQGGDMTRAWNALKDTPFYRRGLEGKSPLDALFFRPDNAQNNMFRRAVMYNRLKREAYAQLGKDASTIVRTQNRITGMLKGNPEAQMRALAKNPDVVMKHAQAVDDFLGNWTRYTVRERKGYSRFIMFYGFLRFATRLAFYTMPVKHPIMSSILLQIGRLEKDELERIFGTDPPPWEYGNLYAAGTGFGQNPPKGEVSRVPTSRLVPFFNALNVDNPGMVVGMLNPVVGLAANQIAGKNVPLDQPYTVDGSSAYVQHSGDLSAKNRIELGVGELLRLSPYVRAAEAAVLRGKQSDDSSLLFPQPIKYPGTTAKSKDAIARNEKRIARQEKRGVFGALQDTLAPQFGTDGSEKIESARSFNASKDKPKKKTKVRKSTNPYLSGSGNPYLD